jgi:hypothetical protein
MVDKKNKIYSPLYQSPPPHSTSFLLVILALFSIEHNNNEAFSLLIKKERLLFDSIITSLMGFP